MKYYSSIKKEQSTDMHNMNESQKQDAEWKKPDTKYILFDFINMKLLGKTNLIFSDRKQKDKSNFIVTERPGLGWVG